MVCILLDSCTPVDLGYVSNETDMLIAELIEGIIRSSNEFALNVDVSRVLGLSDGDITLYIDDIVPDDIPDTLSVVYCSDDFTKQLRKDGQAVLTTALSTPDNVKSLQELLRQLQFELDSISKDFDEYYKSGENSTVIVDDRSIRGLAERDLVDYTFRACSSGNVKELLLLINEYGKEKIVGLRNATSFTPLHHACFNGKYDICNVLLEHGADVAATAQMKMTPLHVSVTAGHILIAKLLLEYNADPFEPDMIGHTALDKARMGNYYAIVDMIGKRESK